MPNYDPEQDKVLEDLGEIPGSQVRVVVKQYADKAARVVFYLQGKERGYPVKKLSLEEALALPAFLEAHKARIEAHR